MHYIGFLAYYLLLKGPSFLGERPRKRAAEEGPMQVANNIIGDYRPVHKPPIMHYIGFLLIILGFCIHDWWTGLKEG